MKAEYKFWFCPDIVVGRDMGSYITVNFDDLNLTELIRDEMNMLISYSAGRIPLGSEIDHKVRVLIKPQVFVESL